MFYSGATIHIDPGQFLRPPIKGFTDLACPAYSFLITHPSGRHVIFDLGVRKDFQNLPPALYGFLKTFCSVDAESDVAQVLREDTALGIKPSDIEAVIWSHTHFDHIGDMSTFPSSVDLVVGPEVRNSVLPGYPQNPEGQVHHSDFSDRNVRDIKFEGVLPFGDCPSYDYFGDGSLVLMSLPGHATGHMAALARVTTGPDTFVLMAGDTCHHGAQFRPNKHFPLPRSSKPSDEIHADSMSVDARAGRDKPFCDPALYVNEEDALRSRDLLSDFDACSNVLVVLAHDTIMRGRMPFFPNTVNSWAQTELKGETRWSFMRDLPPGCPGCP